MGSEMCIRDRGITVPLPSPVPSARRRQAETVRLSVCFDDVPHIYCEPVTLGTKLNISGEPKYALSTTTVPVKARTTVQQRNNLPGTVRQRLEAS